MRIGQLFLFENRVIASWHWKWSITWRWMLTWGRRNPMTKLGFYWMRTHGGGGVLCGLNSRIIGDVAFRLQPNLRRGIANRPPRFDHIKLWLDWQRLSLEARRWLRGWKGREDDLAAYLMFHLNRIARQGVRQKGYFYALKNKLVEHFYRSGFCTNVSLQVQEMPCWGYDWEGCKGESCWKCGGTGIYRTHYLYRFAFNVGGRYYVWHHPRSLVKFDVGSMEMGGKFEQGRSGSEVHLDKDTQHLYYVTLYQYLAARGMADVKPSARPTLRAAVRSDVRRWWWNSKYSRRWRKFADFVTAVKRFYSTGQWWVEEEIPF